MKTCGYDKGYAGKCTQPASTDTKGMSIGFCTEHKDTKCVSCKNPATHECCYCGQFVCGAPLCDECEGWNDRLKEAGGWGFLNHSHRTKKTE